MAATTVPDAAELTDEEFLREFVRRFQCEGALLIYLDAETENWFTRWKNKAGKAWVAEFVAFMRRKPPLPAPPAAPKNKKK